MTFVHEYGWPGLFDTAARTACVMLAVFAGMRMAGKRSLGRMNIYDVVMLLLISNAVQNAMTKGAGGLANGVVSVLTLIVVGACVSAVFARLPGLGERVGGTPTILVDHGKVLRLNMRRESVTEGELMQAVRENGLTEIKDVALGVLELEGTITIVPEDGVDAGSGGKAKHV